MSGNLRGVLDHVRQVHTEQEEPDAEAGRPQQQTRRPKPHETRTTGKSSNPDYQQLKVYVRSELRRKAERKFEDMGGRDLSDLIEQLFNQYLKT